MRKLFLLGDSTCAIKEESKRPETGWGEMFQPYLGDGWLVVNRAVNGMSTRSCIEKGVFSAVLEEVSDGDAAIIQFGHNDQKEDERHTDPWTGYLVNLVYMVDKLRDKGTSAVIATSIPRRRFLSGILQDTHGDYIAAAIAAAHQASVPCINVTLPAMLEYQRIGDEGTRRFHMNFVPGLYANYPDGDDDDTHLRPEGAEFYASLICKLLSVCDVSFLK